MKSDILNRKDIETLVDTFYDKVQKDNIIGYVFNDVAQTNWDNHLPKMYDFWEVILFGAGNFRGNPMLVHRELHSKNPLSYEQFNHWLTLFTQTVDELFEGENAEYIKISASNIARSMSYKVLAS